MRKLFLLTTISLNMVGCGGSSSPTAPSSLPAGFSQTQTATVGAGSSFRHETLTTRAGTLTIRLTWQDPTVDLDLWLLDSACLTVSSACRIVGQSNASAGVSESISRTVTSGERFQTYVENLSSTKPQTYTLTVTVD